jgi:hypothetical protein
MQYAPDPLVGVDRHRALFHDHLVAIDAARNLRHYRFDIGQIGCAGVVLGCAHGDKDGFAALHRTAQIGCELHAPAAMPGQQLRQVLFIDGNAAFAQSLHPGFVVVYADDMMAHFGEANCRNKPHVSGPDHTNGN